MIDNEMSCSPNPQWLKDFKQEIQKEFNLTALDATCVAGKVARIVRKRDRKAWSILKELIDESENDGYCEKHIITQEQFCEAMEE